jgi:hypothetical protein
MALKEGAEGGGGMKSRAREHHRRGSGGGAGREEVGAVQVNNPQPTRYALAELWAGLAFRPVRSSLVCGAALGRNQLPSSPTSCPPAQPAALQPNQLPSPLQSLTKVFWVCGLVHVATG